jgi:ribonuclease HII
MPDYSFENSCRSNGHTVICGTDEAGRGPLAGPVYAAAVILPEGLIIEGLDDSKKLTSAKREKLFEVITHLAVSYGIAFADNTEIDSLNILNASQLAMRRAVAMLDPQPDMVLIDGNVSRGFGCDTLTIVKGDSRSYSIAAASVLAKVARDRYCGEMEKEYPGYGFSVHKGYPTKQHYEAIAAKGVCPLHRLTFLKSLSRHTGGSEK